MMTHIDFSRQPIVTPTASSCHTCRVHDDLQRMSALWLSVSESLINHSYPCHISARNEALKDILKGDDAGPTAFNGL